MNRLKFPLAIALMLFAGVACNPEKDEQQTPDEPSVKTMTINAELMETKTMLGKPDGTKTPVYWNASDEIWVRSAAQVAGTSGNCFKTSSADISAGGKSAKFTGEILDKGPYVAVYPYSCVKSSADNSNFVINVPQTQNYVQDSFADGANFSVAQWAEGSNAQFSNIFGLLSVNVTGAVPVYGLAIEGNDSSFALWGNCTVKIDASSVNYTVSNEGSDRNRVVMNFDSPVTPGETDGKNFIFVLPEGALAKGFALIVYGNGGAVLNTIVTDNDCSIKRNIINRMDPVPAEVTMFSGGKGTKDDPYKIGKAADLVQMAESVNGAESKDYADKFYKQISDINMQDVSVACIGSTSSTPFSGSYDGGGFTISNLSPVPASGKPAGMFAYLSGATVSNLKIDGYTNNGANGEQGVIAGNAKNSTISGIDVNAHAHFVLCACGGIVGLLDGGSVSGCNVSGYYQDEKYGDFQGVTVVSAVGGIVGCAKNKAEIRNCTFKGDVTAAGEQLGGIAGQVSNCVIDNCRVLEGSTVTGDNYYVGGIAGEMLTGGTISNCEVQAHVICWYPGAAGIVAWVQSGNIDNCVVGSLAQVRTGQDKAGGIVAYIYHKDTAQTVNISNCTVYANVAASYSVGGIVGECNPTNNNTKVNIWNCAYLGGEIIDAGYAASKWTMVGGLVAWARMGSTTAELNIVNCFSDPAAIRCDFPQSNEVDMGGFIGEQGGANAKVNIQGCYNTLAYGRAIINSKKDIPSNYYNYGALVGNPTKTNFDHVYYIDSIQGLGKANSGTSSNSQALSVKSMTDGTLLAKLNEFKNSYSGPLSLKSWTGGNNTFPVLEGMAANPSTGKQKALRVSLIGDSLSTFDGYAPHGYQGSRAPNGYRCHYPTSDGNVTTAAQTYWYMLTYDYLSNAVWDTNLAFSGTAVTRCTNSSYSDKYWYGQDFCTRYIENGGMGNPDIIIINGGANDWAHGIYNLLGSQKLVRYPTTTPTRPGDAAMNAVYATADACKTLDEAKNLPDATFVEAYVKLVRMMTLQYPHVKIIVLIHDTLTPDVEESLIHIADHYDNCRYVDLYAVNGFNDLGWNFEYLDLGYQPNMPKHDFDWSAVVKSGDKRQNCSDHYSATAMKFIAEKIYKELGSWLESSASYNESGDGSIGNYDNLNGQW